MDLALTITTELLVKYLFFEPIYSSCHITVGIREELFNPTHGATIFIDDGPTMLVFILLHDAQTKDFAPSFVNIN
jgi:hypothetical protein